MGKRETPARARAVLLPPRPAARSFPQPGDAGREPERDAAPPSSDRTLLRSKESDSSADTSPQAEARPASARLPAGAALTGELLTGVPAESSAGELRASEPPPRQSASVPPLPVVALERPSRSRTDATPSPVPRVSLVPPTGRIDAGQLAALGALDTRHLPTIAPRLRASVIPAPTSLSMPAMTIPRLPQAARRSGLVHRLATDVRSSKREIALGLVIGIVLSFVLGKVGQAYLESRGGARRLSVHSYANEPAPSTRPQGVVPPGRVSPAARAPALPQSASASHTVVEGRTGTPAARPMAPVAPRSAAQPEAVPARSAAAARSRAPRQQPASGSPPGTSSARQRKADGAARARPAAAAPPAPAPRAAAEHSEPGSGAPLVPAARPPSAPAPAPAAPPAELSPAESAGLGLELPL